MKLPPLRILWIKSTLDISDEFTDVSNVDIDESLLRHYIFCIAEHIFDNIER